MLNAPLIDELPPFSPNRKFSGSKGAAKLLEKHLTYSGGRGRCMIDTARAFDWGAAPFISPKPHNRCHNPAFNRLHFCFFFFFEFLFLFFNNSVKTTMMENCFPESERRENFCKKNIFHSKCPTLQKERWRESFLLLFKYQYININVTILLPLIFFFFF